MVPDIHDITAYHSSTPINTVTEAAALEGTPHTLLPATAAAHATLQPMDSPITPHTVRPTCIVTPIPTLIISPTGTTLQTRISLTLAAPAMQHKNLSPEKSSNTQDTHPP